VRLRHEVWHDPGDGHYEFAIASVGGDELRALISPRAEMLHVIYAASTDEAMIAYHAWHGWGAWKPMPGITDQPYDDEWLRRQEIVISRS
jgi:hypothetical protein